jgi:rubredoxin
MSNAEAPEAQFIDNELREPRPGNGNYELPCGYLDESGTLHTEVSLKEITGHEEDLLAAKSNNGAKKITEFLSRCVTGIGSLKPTPHWAEVIRGLTVGDRVYLMFAVRRISLGNIYPVSQVCPRCEHEKVYLFDLADQDMVKNKRIYETVLPKSGKAARFRVLTGKDEERLAKIKSDRDDLSMSILVRLELLDGKAPTMQDVKSLGMQDRNHLREQFEEVEGGVETDVEFQCTNCDHEFERSLDIGQDGFFFPSQVLKRSKKKSGI